MEHARRCRWRWWPWRTSFCHRRADCCSGSQSSTALRGATANAREQKTGWWVGVRGVLSVVVVRVRKAAAARLMQSRTLAACEHSWLVAQLVADTMPREAGLSAHGEQRHNLTSATRPASRMRPRRIRRLLRRSRATASANAPALGSFALDSVRPGPGGRRRRPRRWGVAGAALSPGVHVRVEHSASRDAG